MSSNLSPNADRRDFIISQCTRFQCIFVRYRQDLLQQGKLHLTKCRYLLIVNKLHPTTETSTHSHCCLSVKF